MPVLNFIALGSTVCSVDHQETHIHAQTDRQTDIDFYKHKDCKCSTQKGMWICSTPTSKRLRTKVLENDILLFMSFTIVSLLMKQFKKSIRCFFIHKIMRVFNLYWYILLTYFLLNDIFNSSPFHWHKILDSFPGWKGVLPGKF